MEELKKDIDKIPKDLQSRELTKRIWVFMLTDQIEKKLQNNYDDDDDYSLASHFSELFLICGCLTKSKNPISVEKFAESIADLKIYICDRIHTAKFQTEHTLPCEYKVFEEQPFKQTIEILASVQPGGVSRMRVVRLNSST